MARTSGSCAADDVETGWHRGCAAVTDPVGDPGHRATSAHGERHGAARVVRMIGAGLAAGLVLGVAARFVMRIIALEAGRPGNFSLGGTVDVVAFGMLLGTPLAVLFWSVRSRLPVRRPLAGLVLGLLMFGVLALVPPPSARSAMAATPDTPLHTLLELAILLAVWGCAVDGASLWVTRGPTRRTEARPQDQAKRAPYSRGSVAGREIR